MSLPGELPVMRLKRSASAPYLLGHLQRVDAVAERLGHLAALVVADQTVDEDGLERRPASSARMPEKIMRATQKKMMS